MSVTKEYLCLAHGPFESADDKPECPSGCSTIERRFYTPPGFRSNRTRNIDSTLESVARSHRLTDMGDKAMRRKALKSEKAQQELRDYCQTKYGIGDGGAFAGFGSVPGGGTMNVKTKEITGSGPGAPAAAQKFGAQASDLETVRTSDSPLARAHRIKDPDKLQVDLAKAPA